MKTSNEITKWGTRSVSYWMIMPIALGIIFVGIRFMIDPAVGAKGYGIPFSNPGDIAYGRIKGIRDIFSGLALLPLLFARMQRAAAYVFTAAIIIPLTDCLTVLAVNGPADLLHILMHGLTALYMIITSFLLFKNLQLSTI